MIHCNVCLKFFVVDWFLLTNLFQAKRHIHLFCVGNIPNSSTCPCKASILMLGLNCRIVGKNSIFELFQMHAKTKHKKRETTGFNFINHVLTRIKLSCKSLLYFIFILKALTTFDIKALFNFIRNCVSFEAIAPQFLECRFSSCDDYFL